MRHPDNMGSTTHYQALVDLQAWQVFGFEGLARFIDGRSPLEHLAQARNNGRINELELALVETAISHASSISPDLIVTLNISAETIGNPRLDCLGDNLQGRSWGLEILETAPRADCPASVRRRATDLGCTLLVDDAGAGHSDEVQIRDLHPDIVKIDRELFLEAAHSPEAAFRVGSLMREGRSVGAKLLVEGIETEEQLSRALDMGFDFAQGYFFGRAVPQDEIKDHLAGLEHRLGIKTGSYLP